MELGAAVTVLVFSQYSLPVSTSMCITGATVGVGLCNVSGPPSLPVFNIASYVKLLGFGGTAVSEQVANM